MHSQSYKEKGSRYCGHQERRIAKGKLFKDSNEMTIGYKEIYDLWNEKEYSYFKKLLV